jgi:glucose/arabinose dehydrogenase
MVALVSVAVGATTSWGRTAHSAAGVNLVEIGTFQQPIYVTGAPGNKNDLFVVQRMGQIMLMQNGKTLARPFLNIQPLVNSSGTEQGLLGLAFSPEYRSNGLFYVDYTMPNDNIRIAQYQVSKSNPDVATLSSARIVMTIGHRNDAYANGGDLQFGPDGYLYIGVGDGGQQNDPYNNAQNTDNLLGKILRINPTATGGYKDPGSNPFFRHPGKRGEIWAYGLRNPWRFSFDMKTGDMIIGDVGNTLEEEIDFAPAVNGGNAAKGANYGWSIWEGDDRNKPGTAPNAVFPVLELPHTDSYCAIIGGYVDRDKTTPSLYGQYLFGDHCRPQIEEVTLAPGNATGLAETGMQVIGTTSFGEDDEGHIYVASYYGPVYRIEEQ